MKTVGMRAMSPAILLVAVCLAGCAARGSSSGSDLIRDPNRISEEELRSLPAGSAYDAVERLRANWLRSRSATIAGGTGGTVILPRVFVDERDFGTVESLRGIHMDSVAGIEFMSARDATTRHGTGYAGGIIHVHLKRLPEIV